MNNDLISREYIKLFVCEYEKFNGKETEIVKAVPIQAIDNAPTVEITDYDTGYQDGLEDGLNDIRPQGEWIDHQGFSECDKCHYNTVFGHNFCPHCGADMRGVKNE